MIKTIDYKGKYFILIDEDYKDEFGIDLGKDDIKEEEITDEFLKNHCSQCDYYGIPAYIGNDQKLKDRITKIENDIR